MKKAGPVFKLVVFLSVFFVSGWVFAAGAQAPDPEQKGADPGYSTASDRGITLQWKVDGDNLKVKVSAPTTGWVAVGFDPSMMMKNANIIIGFVKDGKAVIRDDFGTGMGSHRSDLDLKGKDNVADPSGREENGTTEIGFTIPLNSGDDKDKPLVPGKSYKVIMAAGAKDADDFSSPHKKIGKVEIKL